MQSTLNRDVLRRIFQDPRTFATCLLTILLDEYGTEVTEWDAATVSGLLHDLYGPVPEINVDKVQAAVSLLTTDLFWQDPLALTHVADALNNEPVDPDMFEMPSPEAVAWALTEANLLRDPDDRPELSDKVKRFLGALLEEFGILHPPQSLQEAVYARPAEEALADTASDPVLFQGFYDRQKSDVEGVDGYVKDHANTLIQQMDRLPLQNRDTKAWGDVMSRLRKSIRPR